MNKAYRSVVGLSVAAIIILAVASAAVRGDLNWAPLGGPTLGGSGTWDAASTPNWWNGGSNVTWNWGDTAVFGGSQPVNTVTVAGTVTAQGLVFNSANYLVTGETIQFPYNDPNVIVNVNATIGALLAGGGPMHKQGTAALTLTGNNPLAGGTIIDAGTLRLAGANGALASVTDFTFNAGAALVLDNSVSNNDHRIASSAPLYFNQNGAALTLLTNAGGTHETAGIIWVNNEAATVAIAPGVGASTFSFAGLGGRGSWGEIDFQSSALGTPGGGRNILLTGQAAGLMPAWVCANRRDFAVYDAVNGVKAMVDGGGADDYAASATLAADRINRLTGSAILNSDIRIYGLKLGDYNLSGSGTIQFDARAGGLESGLIKTGTMASTIANTLQLGGGYAGEVMIRTEGADLNLTGKLTGSGSVLKSGAATLTLGNAASDFTGVFYIQGGKVVLTNANALGAAGGGNGQDTVIAYGAMLDLNGLTSVPEKIWINGQFGTDGSGKLMSSSGPASVTGDIVLRDGLIGGPNDITLSGQLQEWNLFKVDSNTLTISGGTNNYFGQTHVKNGTVLLAGGENRLPISTLVDLGDVTAGTNGVLDLHGQNQRINGLFSFGPGGDHVVNAGAGTPVLTVNIDGGEDQFAGYLGDTGKNGLSLTKSGGGILSLFQSSTMTGPVLITGGILNLTGANGALASASSFTVQNGAKLKLDNAGSVNNDRLGPSTSVSLKNASVLEFVNNAAGGSEAFHFLTPAKGDATVLISGSSAAATLTSDGLIGRGTAATINFSGVDGTVHQVNIAGATGVIDTWAFVNGTSWAVCKPTGNVQAMVDGPDFNDYAYGPTLTANRFDRLSASANQAAPITVWGLNLGDYGVSGGGLITLSHFSDAKHLGIIKAGDTASVIANPLRIGAAGIDSLSTELIVRTQPVSNDLAYLTLNGAISGSGSIVKTGPGVLTLGGSNSFTGTVYVNGGVTGSPSSAVSISADSNLGNAANGVILNGGELWTTGNISTNRAITIDDLGGVIAVNGTASSLTLHSPLIGGSNLFSKRGTGALTVNSGISHTGLTFIDGGAVTVTGSGTQWVIPSIGEFDVALNNPASANILGGAKVFTGVAKSGISDFTAGAIHVSGVGSELNVSDMLMVGQNGFGDLAIDQGAHVEALYLQSGWANGGLAAITVDGADSRLDLGHELWLGNLAQAAMTLSNGAAATVGWGTYIAARDGPGGLGNLVVQSGATLIGQGELRIGGNAGTTGIVTIATGGSVTTTSDSGWIDIGGESGSVGQVTVTGSGSNFAAQWAPMIVGDAGSGTLHVLAGGRAASDGEVWVANRAGGAGHVLVSGSDSLLAGLSEYGSVVGRYGAGDLTVTDGGCAMFLNSGLAIGQDDGGQPTTGVGQVTVGGSGASATLYTRNIFLGSVGSSGLSSTPSSLTVAAGGSVVIMNGCFGGGMDISANGQLIMAGGTLQAYLVHPLAPEATISGFGTIDSTLYNEGGATIDATGGKLTIGKSWDGNGFNNLGPVTVGNNATLEILDADQAYQDGPVTLTNGVLIVRNGIGLATSASVLSGYGVVVGNVDDFGGAGSTPIFSAPTGTVNLNVNLDIGDHDTRIGSATMATLGPLTTLGNAILFADQGIHLGPGARLVAESSGGWAAVDTRPGSVGEGPGIFLENALLLAASGTQLDVYTQVTGYGILVGNVNTNRFPSGASGKVVLTSDLDIGDREAWIYSNARADIGPLTTVTMAGGRLLTEYGQGIRLLSGSRISGSGTVGDAGWPRTDIVMENAVIDAVSGESITVNGWIAGYGVVIGDATATGGLPVAPTGTVDLPVGIDIGDRTATVYSLGPAALGPASSMAGGNLIAPHGIRIGQDQIFTAYGTVTGNSLLAGGTIDVPDGQTLTITGTGSGYGILLGAVATVGGNSAAGSLVLPAGTPFGVGARTAEFVSATPVALTGGLTIAGGTVTAPAGMSLPAGQTMVGFGTINNWGGLTNNGAIVAEGGPLTFTGMINGIGQGISGEQIHFTGGGGLNGAGVVEAAISGDTTSTIVPTGYMVLGDPDSTAGMEFDGTLAIGGNTIVLLDADKARLGGHTSITGGTLTSSCGILLDSSAPGAGQQLSGYGTVRGSFVNQGLVNGGAGANWLVFKDTVGGAGSWSGNVRFDGAFGIDAGLMTVKTGPGTMTVSGPQNHGAGTTLAVQAGSADLNTDAGGPGIFNLAVNVSGPGTVVHFAAVEHLASLTVGAGSSAVLVAGGNNTLRTPALTLAGASDAWTSKLDVNENKLIIDNANSAAAATTYTRINNQLKQGFDNGAWDGQGITSTKAQTDVNNGIPVTIGVVNNDDGTGNPAFFHDGSDLPQFGGQTVNGTAVLTKYTYFGDADLSGAVDAVDYTFFVAGVQSGGSLTGWEWGDFDYSGTVDAVDYSFFVFGVQGQGATLATGASGPSSVPEPASLALLGVAGVMMMSRRGRRI